MKYALILLLAAGITAALPPQQEKTVTITLPISQWNTVIKGLNELPFKESAEVINTIQVQANRQLTAPPIPAKSDSTKPKKQ